MVEEQIKRTAAAVKRLYYLFWLLPCLYVLAGEAELAWVGVYASQQQAVYWAETLSILLVAVGVPVSLKLFAWVLNRRMAAASLPKALRLYAAWYGVRLFLLALPVCVGLFTYYSMLSSKGLLCALIALTASLFCLPGEERLRRELHIDKEG